MMENNQENLLKEIKQTEVDFIKLIYERLGIVIKHHQTHDLHKTILNAYHKFNYAPKDYLAKLINCKDHSPLLEHFIAGVTVGETYFFRDNHQIQLLENKILTRIIEQKRQQNNLSLRIWSAGVATGEEIYTIAMLLSEMIPDIDKWRITLLATDINTEALKKAIIGFYNEWSMRSIQDYFKQRYFSTINRGYSFSPKLRELVHFDYLNLNDDTYPAIFNGTNAQDLILCRNVFIYFDNTKIARLMQKLNACLVPGGYLLLGASDPVNLSGTDFIFHHHDGLIFTRPTEEKISVEAKKPIVSEKVKVVNKVKNKVKETKIYQVKNIPDKKKPDYSYQDKISELLKESNWQAALNMVDLFETLEKNTQFIFFSKAIALANLGKLAEAEKVCQEGLKYHATDKDMYFTYALIHIELNHLVEAEKMLRKTLFLDHQFVPGHFQLGLLLLRNKQIELGLKSLCNALIIAKAKDPKEKVISSQGLCYGRFVEIVKQEIELHTLSGNKNYANQSA